MGGNDLLSGGSEDLNVIKELVIELQGHQKELENLVVEEETIEKSMESTKKEMADDIATTLKKRKQEIENTYDEQLDKVKAKIKKTKEKRSKHKSRKVSERIKQETAHLHAKSKQCNLECKTLIKKNHLPRICNTRLYNALYAPSRFQDGLIILATIIVAFLAIPCGVYYFLLQDQGLIYLALTYLLAIVIFFGAYFLLGHKTKEKQPEVIKQVRDIRNEIRDHHKQIQRIKKRVKKDKDESGYNLTQYDDELELFNQEEKDIVEKKKEALLVFENTTSQVIETEIRSQYEEKLSSFQHQYNEVNAKAQKAENSVKENTLKLAGEYEPFLGKEFMKVDKLDALIDIIQEGNGQTVSDAINYYKKNTEQ